MDDCPASGNSEQCVPGDAQSADYVECLSRAVDKQIEIALKECSDGDGEGDEFYSCSDDDDDYDVDQRCAVTTGENLTLTGDSEHVLNEVHSTNDSETGLGTSAGEHSLNEISEGNSSPYLDSGVVKTDSERTSGSETAKDDSVDSRIEGDVSGSEIEGGLVDAHADASTTQQDTDPNTDELQEDEIVDESSADTTHKPNTEKSEEEKLRELEENMTDEEKESRKIEATNLKQEANILFRDQNYVDARQMYSKALEISPVCFPKERAILYANRAACKAKMEESVEAIKDCSKAVELHPQYTKAFMRRAELYEKTDKLDEALQDYQKVLELDPSVHIARAACLRLPEQIKERNEKLKEEMFGKLKDLGNMVLKPFGLSTNNFKLQQDPNTGGYSVQFQQNSNDS